MGKPSHRRRTPLSQSCTAGIEGREKHFHSCCSHWRKTGEDTMLLAAHHGRGRCWRKKMIVKDIRPSLLPAYWEMKQTAPEEEHHTHELDPVHNPSLPIIPSTNCEEFNFEKANDNCPGLPTDENVNPGCLSPIPNESMINDSSLHTDESNTAPAHDENDGANEPVLPDLHHDTSGNIIKPHSGSPPGMRAWYLQALERCGRPDDSITKPRSDEPPRQVLRALALNHRPHYGERRPIQNDAKHNRQRTHNRGSLFNCVRAHESAGNYPSKSNEFYYEQPRHFPPGFGVILVEKDGEIGELQENAQAVNGHDENAVRMDEWHGVEHPHEAVHQRRMDSADEKQFLIHYCTMGESIGDRMKLINPRMDGDEN
nr:hypothetical protein Iba_chr12eCG9700 [Ipomoea batatas]